MDGAPGLRRGARSVYRQDVSVRYIEPSTSSPRSSVEQTCRRAGARRPRPAPRVADARLRAPQAAQRDAGNLPGLLVRLALPLPQGAARPGSHRRGRGEQRHRGRQRPRSSTSSPRRARSTCRTCSTPPGPQRGRTRASACTSRSSARPTPPYACASSRGAAAGLEERLDNVRSSLSRTRERLDTYTIELQKHGLESVEREVRWLNELISDERQRTNRTQADLQNVPPSKADRAVPGTTDRSISESKE